MTVHARVRRWQRAGVRKAEWELFPLNRPTGSWRCEEEGDARNPMHVVTVEKAASK